MTEELSSPIRRLLPWLIVLLYLTAIELLVGWAAVFSAWQSVSPGAAALGLGFMLISYWARISRNYGYFVPETSGRYKDVARITVIHNMLNQLLPMRSGELSFPLYMKREFAMDYARSGTGLLWFRLLDLHTLLSFGLLMVILSHQSLPAIWVLWLAVTLAPVVLYLIRGRLRAILQARLPEGRIKDLLRQAMAGLPAGKWVFARSWGWTVLNWVAKFAALMGLLYQFVPAPLGTLALGVISGELTSVLPIHAPGGVGTYEAGVAAGLSLFTFDYEALLTGAVNIHLFILTLASALGVIGLISSTSRR